MHLIVLNSWGQSDTLVYEDIRHRWAVYDYGEKLYVPYLPHVHSPVHHLHLIIQPFEWQPAHQLIIPISKETLLFINNNLTHHIQQPTTLVWDLDSLSRLGNKLLLTLVQTDAIQTTPAVFLGWRQPIKYKLYSPSDSLLSKKFSTGLTPGVQTTARRNSHWQKSQLLLTALTCGMLLAAFSLLDAQSVSIGKSLKQVVLLFKYKSIQEKTTLVDLLVCSIVCAITAAYLWLLADYYQAASVPEPTYAVEEKLFLASYLQAFSGALLFLFVKYALIYWLGNLFKHDLLAEKHIAISINVHKIVVLLIFIVFVAYQMSHYYRPYFSSHWLAYTLPGGLVSITVATSIILYFSVAHSFIYLIAYLCATEVLPLLLILKLFF
ncbi:MAG: DUF4271 domain-containing protein [Bernardetiaceae bacterium]|nr:DUF4271 domain-containing protein [Bernardetiaceae bacterium]